MSDPVKAIMRGLRRRCGALAECRLEFDESRPWRSLLFDGARHHIRLVLSGPEVDQAIDRLRGAADDPDFAISGHVVAEISLSTIDRDGAEARIGVEALTISA